MDILRRITHKAEAPAHASRAVLLNPLPDYEESTAQVETLAHDLHAKFLHGLELKPSDIPPVVSGSTLFHYHGHIEYNAESALDSCMLLYDPRGKPKLTEAQRIEKIVAARDLFKAKLDSPALATMIGCGSGVTAV